MKKLVFREKTGEKPKNREVSYEEINDKSPLKVSKKWSCKHFIKEAYTSTRKQDVQDWVSMKKSAKCRKDCHLMRYYNTRTGENKIICKVLGDIFVIRGNTAYQIVYVNEFRIKVDMMNKVREKL